MAHLWAADTQSTGPATVIVYALSLIDAYVDAQLFDYDISPDLTLNVEPQIYYDLQNQQKSAEIKLAIQF